MHISSLEQIFVAGVMHRGVITCPPETLLASVARTLFENRIHAIFVAGEWAREGYEEMVWGVVFDTDVVRAACEGGLDRAVGDVAHQEMVTVRPEAPLSEAVAVMAEQHLTHLVVVDAPLEPVGILSTFDVMGVLGAAR